MGLAGSGTGTVGLGLHLKGSYCALLVYSNVWEYLEEYTHRTFSCSLAFAPGLALTLAYTHVMSAPWEEKSCVNVIQSFSSSHSPSCVDTCALARVAGRSTSAHPRPRFHQRYTACRPQTARGVIITAPKQSAYSVQGWDEMECHHMS